MTRNCAIARLVQESLWGYPFVLSAHAVGMAILAGIVLMINFRVFGLAPLISLSGLKTMYRVAWVGFVINVISGFMLFVSNADAFVQSRLAGLNALWFKLSLDEQALSPEPFVSPRATVRWIAGVSLLL